MNFLTIHKSEKFFQDNSIKFNNLKFFSNRQREIYDSIYAKKSQLEEIKPPNQLLKRKYTNLFTVKFPTNTPKLTLPKFNNKAIVLKENFTIREGRNENRIYKNIMNIKELHIDTYININKLIKHLIYTKNPIKDNDRVSLDNIINLNKIKIKNIQEKKNTYDIKDNNLSNIDNSKNNLVSFESNFESGNLQLAYYMNPLRDYTEENNDIDYYQLFLQNDTNTLGYSQWFFFRITNGKKGQKINLNIMNFLRKTTKYMRGLKVWYFSKKKKDEMNIGWHHIGGKVEYNPNFLYKFIQGKRQNYYSLSFEYTFEFEDDEVYFANCLPYMYSDLMNDLNEYSKKENDKYFFFDLKKLCSTILGNEVLYFVINNNNGIVNFDKNNKNKKGIVLLARQHPGETVGSWVLKGAIEFIMGDSIEAKYLRENFIIKIIPILNVDGVICGNSRTSLAGCDLNRRWETPNIYLHPEVYYSKDLILEFSKNFNIEYIIDFHGHFGTFNAFFYANNSEEDIIYCRKFPFICSMVSNIIQFKKCSFKMPKYKIGTGRINLYNELNIENIITLESSYFGCNEGKYSNVYLNIEYMKEIGRDVCYGIILSHYDKYKNNLSQIICKDSDLKKKIEDQLGIIKDEFDEYIDHITNRKFSQKYADQLANIGDDITDSESEPSRENLDENEIKKLIPLTSEKKKIKKLKKNFSYFRNVKIIKGKNKINLSKGINLPTLKKHIFIKSDKIFPRYGENNNKVITIHGILNEGAKTPINELPNKFLFKNKKIKYSSSALSHQNYFLGSFTEEKSTQTEEIFFKNHWSLFANCYKILSYKAEKNESFNNDKIKVNKISFLSKNLKSESTMVAMSPKIFPYRTQNKISTNDEKIISINFNYKKRKSNNLNFNSKQENFCLSSVSKNKIHHRNGEKIPFIVEKKFLKIKNIPPTKEKESSFHNLIISFLSKISNSNRKNFLERYLSNDC